MRGSERAILLVIPLVAVLIGIWVLLISPKRSEEADLSNQVSGLRAQADQAQGEVAQSELARKGFDDNYAALVDLGAAAPADADQSSLVYSLAHMANENDLRFGSFTLSDTSGSTAAAASTAATTTSSTSTPAASGSSSSGTSTTSTTATDSGTSGTSTDGTSSSTTGATTSSTTSTATSAAPTEATAATLPLGAAVGPAGLPVSSYAFSLSGRYFDTADFLADLDSLVEASPTKAPSVHGRLFTVDGFSLVLDDFSSFPMMQANLSVTTYGVPADQGIEAGATPAGPAPAGATDSTTATAAPTASVSP